MTRRELEVEAVRLGPDGSVTALRAWEVFDDAGPVAVERPQGAALPAPGHRAARRRQRRVLRAMAAAWLILVAVAAAGFYALAEAVAR